MLIRPELIRPELVPAAGGAEPPELPALLWRAGDGWRMIASAVTGGGIGTRTWVLNAQVTAGYARCDPEAHLVELAAPHGLAGPGVGMLTAADVTAFQHATDSGVEVLATVGLGVPTWAAAPDEPMPPPAAGTINLVLAVPVRFSDAALVNAVVTATEAKAQALGDAGIPCTGTASDAICVATRTVGPVEPFGGPRSTWGARLARAVHGAVLAGAASYADEL